MKALLFASVLGLIAGPALAADEVVGSLIDTVWNAVAAQKDGQTDDHLKDHKLAFGREGFLITNKDGKVIYKGIFRIDATKRPATIDFIHTDGALKGTTWLGIYQMDGDNLQICDNAEDPRQPRPAAFITKPTSGHILVKFQRISK